jgi:hypothetical protein
MTPKQQDALDNIMDSFDFDQVHKVMVFLNWKWANGKGSLEVPEKYELRSEARRLLKMAIEEKTTVSTGGFIAEYREGEEGGWMDLKFVISDWDEEVKNG